MDWEQVNGANFERWAVGPGQWLCIRPGFVMVVHGPFRVRGLVSFMGAAMLRIRRDVQ